MTARALLLARTARMTVYKNTLRTPVLSAARAALDRPELHAVSEIFSAAAQEGFPGDPARAVAAAALYDDNAFTRALSRGEEAFLPDNVREAALYDLETLELLSRLTPADFALDSPVPPPLWAPGEAPAPLSGHWGGNLSALTEFYRKNGTGDFAKYRAFIWNGGLNAVKNPDPIRFCDLKGYERERGAVAGNIRRFLAGAPANNMLLYGDRGTGKSATIHSLVNEFGDRGLRLVELSKNSLSRLSALSDLVKNQPLRFLLFIDDLTFSETDGDYAALKAVLEGSLETTPENCLLCATSNRRHLIRESHGERAGDDVRRADTLEEQHSLSDRFGLTVTFLKPSRDEYLMIVSRLARDRGVELPESELFAAAEKWALSKGGRSPRAAVQFLRSLAPPQGKS